MATGATIGWGAEFSLYNGTALTPLAEVFEMTLPNEQADDVEVTHYKSPGRKREYIRGLIETGEATVSMNYVPGSVTDVLVTAAKVAGDTRAYKIVIPGPDGLPAWEVDGFCYVKGYERNIPIDDRITAMLTIKFTGDTVEAAAA